MEQNTNNQISKKRLSFWNKPTGRSLIFFGILLMFGWYLTHWVPRQNCEKEIQYHPANKVMEEGFYTVGMGQPSSFSPTGYSTVTSVKFKYREEAVDHCIRNK